MGEKDDKAERLAAALRENLRRRKAQAREINGSSPANGAAADVATGEADQR